MRIFPCVLFPTYLGHQENRDPFSSLIEDRWWRCFFFLPVNLRQASQKSFRICCQPVQGPGKVAMHVLYQAPPTTCFVLNRFFNIVLRPALLLRHGPWGPFLIPPFPVLEAPQIDLVLYRFLYAQPQSANSCHPPSTPGFFPILIPVLRTKTSRERSFLLPSSM